MKCLLVAAVVFGGTFLLALAVVVLRYVLWPLGRVIAAYWDWCSRTFQSEFWEMIFAVTPLVAAMFAVLAAIICWIDK